MYTRCPSCTRPLGGNEALEHFPVGRRLAFDTGKGRLWVLCARCRSWNLAPIEERWEAVEEAERAFEGAALGAGTEHIAIGRLAEGTELIRIGEARAPELAGWRYAKRISDRWKRAQIVGAVGTTAWVVLGPAGSFGPLAPLVVTGFVGWGIWDRVRKRGRRLEIPRDDGPPRIVTRGRLGHIHLVAEEDGPVSEPGSDDAPGWSLEVRSPGYPALVIPPDLRNRALRLSLLELNKSIGRPAHVDKALDRVVRAGDPARLAGLAARALGEDRPWGHHMGWPFRERTALRAADPVLRLAVEIAANEEVERRALEGELQLLEREWREAEELAAISDDLLIPAWARRRIAEWRGEG